MNPCRSVHSDQTGSSLLPSAVPTVCERISYTLNGGFMVQHHTDFDHIEYENACKAKLRLIYETGARKTRDVEEQ